MHPADAGARTARRTIWIVVAAGIALAIGGSTFFLTQSRLDADLSGLWVARMQSPGHPSFTLRLRLERNGNAISGQATFPVGAAIIQDGVLSDRALTFVTAGVPLESKSSTVRFSGQVSNRALALAAASDGGPTWKGVARKAE